MQIIPLGDQAVLVEFDQRIDPDINRQVVALHNRLLQLEDKGITWSTPAFCSLGIGFEPSKISYADLVCLIQEQFNLIEDVVDHQPTVVRIPVCYCESFGIDLQHVAEQTGFSIDQIIELHSGTTYHAYMLGFLPGFAYLGSVNSKLRVDRQAEPRAKVVAGSVGLAGEQTGIYPCDAPGGWQILGRTPIALNNKNDSSKFLISPGDQVQFYPIDQTEFDSLLEKNEAAEPSGAEVQTETQVTESQDRDSISIHFKTAGLRTTIQDSGRTGHQHYGIPSGGAMDSFSASVANTLVGNRGKASLIEMTLMGPVIKFSGDCQIAITGADLSPKLDGQSIPMWETVSVKGAQRLSFGARQNGCRSYLAIAGEIQAPKWLDSVSPSPTGVNPATDFRSLKGETICVSAWSRSTLQRSQLAHRHTGDQSFSLAGRPPCLRDTTVGVYEMVVPIVPGPEWNWFSKQQQAAFLEHHFEISQHSNSMGYRLSSFLKESGDSFDEPPKQQSMISSAVVPGVIQVAPSGQAILLMRDAQTTGGYPRIGVVCHELLDEVAQLCPGDLIRFEFNWRNKG